MVDYKELGFKAGLEIHQQIEGRKLFCHCPALVNDDNLSDVKFKRKLRAIAGETGKVDKAAEFEMSKDKEVFYEACSSSSCLVEYDEEPPHELNKEALEVALQIALLMNCKVVDKIQFMRKTVIDGSNVSGFQRTALIGNDGFIETNKGKVKIETICLEEEAAKKIKEEENKITYRLDRLGVGLIEIATSPDIRDPEHAKEVASIIGMMLRSTGRVKRGIGSIRQDVNVSIKGHERVEIKGFQDLRNIPKTIENEIHRQLKSKDEKSHVRKVNPDFTTSYLRPMPGSSRMYPETDIEIITITNKLLDSIELPELISERALALKNKYNLNEDISRELVKLEVDFESYVNEFSKIKPDFIANVLVETKKDILARYKKEVTFEMVKNALSYYNENKIAKDAVYEVLVDFAVNGTVNLKKYEKADESEIENDIKHIVSKNKDLSFSALMGDIMKKYKGKIDGKKASELLKKYLNAK
ncbi:MAG: Glu-tRNA(Gln) amidotransferase subunit GatE [Candidatus Nanoarchaeia archaeon]|nr:Glu-tRNA(Gln) amidotransferase subunit GatE [Candidatus Nanoarchaeia archaeon]